MASTRTISEHEAAYRPALEALAGLDTDRAGVHNLAGFSAADSRFGHDLVKQSWPWTPRQCGAVYRMLKRYAKTQLPGLGFDLTEMPSPPDVANRLAPAPESGQAAPAPRTIEPPRIWINPDVAGKIACVRWPYSDPQSDERMRLIREIPGAQWHPTERYWLVPVNETSVPGLSQMIEAFAGKAGAFRIEPDLAEMVTTVAERLHQALTASRAKDADIHIMGLVDPSMLRPFQRAGVAYLLKHRKTMLADSPGVGKTVQSIATVATAGCQRILIVCPASLKLNWKREILMWTGEHEHEITVFDGAKPTGPIMPRRWSIVNYDLLDGWKDELSGQAWDAVICDEHTALKSPKAKRTKAMGAVLKAANPAYVLMLSGTPILNRPMELWPILQMLGRANEFGGFKTYATRYCNLTYGRFGMDTSGASNLDELNMRLRGGGMMIRRRKEEILTELPPRIWSQVPVVMNKQQTAAYDHAEAALQAAIESGEPGAVLVRISELRQLAARIKLDQARPWIDQMLENGEKFVVMAWHREITEEVSRQYNAPKIVGGQNRADIEEGKRRFQEDDDCRVISCNIAAGGMGHTLTAASNTLFLEQAWNGALMDQALDRTHRIGSTADSVTGWVMILEHPRGLETIDDYMNEVVSGKRLVTNETSDGAGESRQHESLDRMLGALRQAETDELDGDDDRNAAA